VRTQVKFFKNKNFVLKFLEIDLFLLPKGLDNKLAHDTKIGILIPIPEHKYSFHTPIFEKRFYSPQIIRTID
jgi:hypothetical protein